MVNIHDNPEILKGETPMNILQAAKDFLHCQREIKQLRRRLNVAQAYIQHQRGEIRRLEDLLWERKGIVRL
jgi:hypothetical protein